MRRQPLFEASGVDEEIRSTLSRRVDLPSGGYLIFDYAEAFTVIDVNTGRFVGSRSKSSGARLEDTITKNNLEAVKEVVRQLRLRDIGGIIVIDFIDMGSPKNRATVEEALKNELERDRTKTYVVEISPLGLVEMTRQNVTDGPREIMTRKCPTCSGDGVVLSETTAAIDVERKLRTLAAGSRAKAFRVELNARVAALLVGPGARAAGRARGAARSAASSSRRARTSISTTSPCLSRGTVEKLAPKAPIAEDAELQLELVEVGLHDAGAGIGKVDGYSVEVAGAAKLVGKKVKARIEPGARRDGVRHAAPAGAPGGADAPITAEAEAEKPTRAPRRKKAEEAQRGRGRRSAGRAGGSRCREPVRRGSGHRGSCCRARGRRRCRGAERRRGAAQAEEEDAARVAWRTRPEEEARSERPLRRTATRPPRERSKPAEAEPQEARLCRRSTSRTPISARPRRPSRAGARRRRSSRSRARRPGAARAEGATGAASRPRPAERRAGRRGSPARPSRAYARRVSVAPRSNDSLRPPAPRHGTKPGLRYTSASRAARPAFARLMSYAIISVGGKQHRVREGEKLLVERLGVDEGKTFEPPRPDARRRRRSRSRRRRTVP